MQFNSKVMYLLEIKVTQNEPVIINRMLIIKLLVKNTSPGVKRTL